MKHLLLLLLTLSTGLATAQDTITITAKMKDCGEQIYAFEYRAMQLHPISQAPLQKRNSYELQLSTNEPKMVFIGMLPNEVIPVIIGPDKQFTITGSCETAQRSEITGSPLNQQYQQLQDSIRTHKNTHGKLMREMRRAEVNSQRDAITQQMQALDQRQLKLLDSLQKHQPILGKILALNTYLAFPTNGSAYDNEVDYFGNEFFRFVDFSNGAYDQLPNVSDAFFNYTGSLSSVNLPKETLDLFLTRSLQLTGQPGKTHEYALTGILRALSNSQNGLFVKYGKRFIEAYGLQYPQFSKELQKQIQQFVLIEEGEIAPDFTQLTPEDKPFSLSNLRGKYVLIDFWASWCGPCRRENPNVVRLYNTYKDKGFEILGVSLDRDRTRWLDAIENDQLTWLHVSDLKGWSNAVAKQYNIRAIPHTILIDPEGRIIGQKLRGASLEAKLKELFDTSE